MTVVSLKAFLEAWGRLWWKQPLGGWAPESPITIAMADEIIEPESQLSVMKATGDGNSGGGATADDKCNQAASMSTLGRSVGGMTLHDFTMCHDVIVQVAVGEVSFRVWGLRRDDLNSHVI